MSAPAMQEMLATELWFSFVSLLRSYAAAASLNGDRTAEIAVGEHSVAIVVEPCAIEMHYDPNRAAGNWQVRRGDRQATHGVFELLPEGSMALDGETLDLDHAAIDFVACVMDAAARTASKE